MKRLSELHAANDNHSSYSRPHKVSWTHHTLKTRRSLIFKDNVSAQKHAKMMRSQRMHGVTVQQEE